jgi:hypothetical protein
MTGLTFIVLTWSLTVGSADSKSNYDHIVGVLNILFGPVITLVGSATGFYFGSQVKASQNNTAISETNTK